LKVSVLITNYNRHTLCDEAVSSVLEQRYQDVEVIIVDDGSDEVNPNQSRYATLGIKYILQKNCGQAAALNAAFSNSSGKVICLLDSDDLQEASYISSVVDFFQREPDCDVLYSAPIPIRHPTSITNEADILRRIRDLSPTGPVVGNGLICLTKPYAWVGNPTSGISIRRAAAEQLFPLWAPTSWSLAADQILCQKITLKNLNVFRSNTLGFYYRVHSNNGYLNPSSRIVYESTRDAVLSDSRRDAGCIFTKRELVQQYLNKRKSLGWVILIIGLFKRAPQLILLRT
jgi:glycosyltransferase involved in cell wall biosynthesis